MLRIQYINPNEPITNAERGCEEDACSSGQTKKTQAIILLTCTECKHYIEQWYNLLHEHVRKKEDLPQLHRIFLYSMVE